MTYRKKRTEIAFKRLFQWYLKKEWWLLWKTAPKITNGTSLDFVHQMLRHMQLFHTWMQRLVPSQGAGITIWQHFLSGTCFVCWLFPLEFPLGPDQPGETRPTGPALVSWQFPWFWEVSLSLRLVSVVVLKTNWPGVLQKKSWPGLHVLFRSLGSGKVSPPAPLNSKSEANC